MTQPPGTSAEELGAAERIALAYAPPTLRSAYRGVLLLDGQLRRIALGAREPALAQLKLAWWRDACAQLSVRQVHPVLQALAPAWEAEPGELVGLVDAWEECAAGEGGLPAGAEAVARGRAAVLARAARERESAECVAAARRWTMVALSCRAGERGERAEMIGAAARIGTLPLPRALRPLAVLDGLALRAALRDSADLLGDRLSPFAAIRLGIFGR